MELFKIFGTIALDNSGAIKGMNETADTAQRTGNTMAQSAVQAEGKMSSAFSKIGKSAVAVGKVIASGLAVGATAIGVLAKKSLDSYADYEQLVGGVETLFGAGGKSVEEYAESVGKTVLEIQEEYDGLMKAQQAVLANANDAYKTAGMSANEYMETVTGFASALTKSVARVAQTNIEELEASLNNQYEVTKRAYEDEYDALKNSWADRIALAKKNKDANVALLNQQRDQELKTLKRANDDKLKALQSYNEEQVKLAEQANSMSEITAETQLESAKKADMAIRDMADNANKMGTALESIQTAYQGFAKQNYTMLDNLKLGYGGTKEEMERLLNDAESISGIEYDISSYADIVDAIHVVQTEMGITGTTLDEASKTISGSISAMKSSFTNLLAGFGKEDADLSGLTDQLVESFTTVMQNVIPRLQVILGGITDVIAQLAPVLLEAIKGLFGQVWDYVSLELLGTGVSFDDAMSKISGAFANVWTVMQGIWNSIGQPIWDAISYAFSYVKQNWDSISASISTGFQVVWELCQSIWTNIGQPIWDMISFAIDSVMGLFKDNMPAITGFFQDAIAGIKDTWDNHLKPVFDAIGKVLNDYVKPAFEYVWKKIIEPLIRNVFSIIGKLWTETLKPVFDGICDFITGIFTGNWQKMGDGIMGIVKGLWDGIVNIFEGIWNFLCDVWNNIKDDVMGLVNTIVDKVVGAFNSFKEKVSEVFNKVKQTITNIWTGIWNGIKGFVNKILGGIEGMVNGVVNGINAIISGINSVISTAGELVGLKVAIPTMSTVSLPRLEQGGILEKGQVGLLEGNGAEAVVPLDQNEKWINKVAQDMNGAVGDNAILQKILDVLVDLREMLPEELTESIASLKFEINNREFARLVKGV